jgi:glycosyltransferase involved in cell wall biosynthesis
VIYNGVDTNLFQAPEVPKNTGYPVCILTVARLLELKGIQYLLEALSQLPKDQFHLSIVRTGYFERELKGKTALLNLAGSVAFL